MKLSAYIERENLTYAGFGRLCDPAIPRPTIRQYALELRFPRSKATIQNIAKASKGEVTANDFCETAEAAE